METQDIAPSIQMTLFDYFLDTESFTLEDAKAAVNAVKSVKEPSIRARIYEGIDKGLFERVGKGVYTVKKKGIDGKESSCLVLNGDGRDLSMFADNSFDALITDHPYFLPKSLKGGNRNFAEYEAFQYTEDDMKEKFRVLKPGCFLVEFLPEENGDNFRYIFQIKDMAERAGLSYYASVPWKKGDFVANTGRKSKNTEQVVMFTKGKARSLRPDAKKDKEEPDVEHYMSGAKGMLPTVFDISPVDKKDKIHQAEKPVELLTQIMDFVTLPGEKILDQFAGSGVTGAAALESGRDAVLIEKDTETFANIVERLEEYEYE